MAPAFSKEAILTGEVDHFCLVCENYMRSEHEVAAHVTKPEHRRRLEDTDYVEKYKGDRIRKVKKWYFCEFCNVLLSTLKKVGLHVKEENHTVIKTSKVIERKGEFVVLLENIAITEESWHGLSDNNCILCDCEFDDRDVHKNESLHIINLIKSKVRYMDNIVYRKVEEDTFHCLICNESVAKISDHLRETKHDEFLAECKQILSKYQVSPNKITFTESITEKKSNVDEIKDVNKNTDEKKNDNVKKEATENKDVIEKKNDDEKKNVDENKHSYEHKDANEKKDANKEKNVYDKKYTDKRKEANEKKHTKIADAVSYLDSIKVTETPGKKTKENINSTDKQKKECDATFDRHVCQALRAEDYISRNSDGSNWCILCDWEIDSSDIKIHLDSEHHQTILKMHKKRGKELNAAELDVSNNTTNDTSDILNSIERLQANNININFETLAAVCKTCSKSLEFDLKIIENHIQEHKKLDQKEVPVTTPILFENNESNEPTHPKNDKGSGELKPSKKRDEDLQKLIAEHELIHKADSKKVHCPKCRKDIPCSIKNINEHIFGISHTNHVQLASSSKKRSKGNEIVKKNNTKKCELKKVPLDVFSENVIIAEKCDCHFFVINEKYVIIFLTIMFIAPISNNKSSCLVCGVKFKSKETPIHLMNVKHLRILQESSVIIHPDGEFIRELPTGLFHCGYCNTIDSTWDRMEDHLKLTSHRENKNIANWLLVQFMPDIEQNRSQRVVQNDLFGNLHNLRFY